MVMVLKFQFIRGPSGGTIIVKESSNLHRKLDSFPSVILAQATKISIAFGLDDTHKSELIAGLEGCKTIYQMSEAINIPKDTAIAKWIGDLQKSIDLIALAASKDPKKYGHAIGYMGKVLDEDAKNEIDGQICTISDLTNWGFDIQELPDHIELGGEKFIERWFKQATLVSQIARLTMERLQELNRPRDRLSDGITKEAMLYGHCLPKLYSKITGRDFHMERKNGEFQCNESAVFAMRSGEAIGLPRVTASTINWHISNLAKKNM